jgi:uncharacterized LabA/DUF88 family protein
MNDTNTDPSQTRHADRHIALLIDADNVSAAKLPLILAELAKYGTANVRRAYGDWTAPTLKGWTARLHEYAIRPIQQFSYSKGKNATDIALVIDAMELLYTQKLAAFCIASSDADFTPLVMHLRAAGQDVYGFGERKTPEPFVNACTTFLYLDSLTGAVAEEPVVQTAAKPVAKKSAKSAKAAEEMPDDKPARTLAQDTKLVAALRGAVEACKGEDGWAPLGAAGAAVRRQAPIDPRNYDRKNFRALFEDTGLFVIDRAPNGQPYIADKRNKDRSPKPTAS